MRPLFLNMNNFLIKVTVYPDSKKEKIIKKDNRLLIYLKESAKRGEANKRVLKILSFIYKNKRLECVKGLKGRNKIFKVSL